MRSRLINLQMFIEFLHWGFGRAGIATIVHAELDLRRNGQNKGLEPERFSTERSFCRLSKEVTMEESVYQARWLLITMLILAAGMVVVGVVAS